MGRAQELGQLLLDQQLREDADIVVLDGPPHQSEPQLLLDEGPELVEQAALENVQGRLGPPSHLLGRRPVDDDPEQPLLGDAEQPLADRGRREPHVGERRLEGLADGLRVGERADLLDEPLQLAGVEPDGVPQGARRRRGQRVPPREQGDEPLADVVGPLLEVLVEPVARVVDEEGARQVGEPLAGVGPPPHLLQGLAGRGCPAPPRRSRRAARAAARPWSSRGRGSRGRRSSTPAGSAGAAAAAAPRGPDRATRGRGARDGARWRRGRRRRRHRPGSSGPRLPRARPRRRSAPPESS